MSFDAVLSLEIRRFWFLVQQMGRISAEQSIDQLHILAAATSQEGMEAAQSGLKQTLGEIFIYGQDTTAVVINADTGEEMDPEFERGKLLALKEKYCA